MARAVRPPGHRPNLDIEHLAASLLRQLAEDARYVAVNSKPVGKGLVSDPQKGLSIGTVTAQWDF